MRKMIFLLFIISILVLVGCEKSTPATCPTVNTPEKFFPVKSNDMIILDTKGVTVGEGYKIAPAEKQGSPFFQNGVSCHLGKETGENVNNLYCDQLMIQKLITNDAGDIVEEQITGVQFIFDKDSKLIGKKCFK